MMHHYYDLLIYILARQSNLNEGVQIAYLISRYKIIHLPIIQRMYQNKSYQD
jgi:hypothetical protein